jgi:ubiquinone biosynthesis protein
VSWRYHPVVRRARVFAGLARIMPRYLVLILRDRTQRLATTQRAWDRVHHAAAREIRNIALGFAGAFTKAAQIGGARADILPQPFIDELSQFHDAVPPRPYEAMHEIIERELGGDLGEFFATFEREALAAASLAQVHRATLPDGTEIVVKVQYPEIQRVIPSDLNILRRVVRLIQRLQSHIDLRTIVEEVTSNIELELDFAREVASTQRLGGILAEAPGVRVPAVHVDLCRGHVIVLEYIEGIQVSRTEELVAAGHRLSDVARRIGALYGEMIFEHGFFHGDPHPGNLLVLPDGTIALLDFGLCKELPKGFAGLLAEMMVSAMVGDSPRALAAASELGFEIDSLEADHLRTMMLMTIGDSDGDDSFFDIVSASRIRKIPDDFALVVRTLILLNGLSHRLVPGRRLIQAELLKHLAAGAARRPPASRSSTG